MRKNFGCVVIIAAMAIFFIVLFIVIAVTIFFAAKEPYKSGKSALAITQAPKISEITNISGVEKIPDNVYSSTSPKDGLYKIINASTKIIYWSGPDCYQGKGFKRELEDAFRQNNLSSYYQHYPDLHSTGVWVRCSDGSVDCAQNYLYGNCSEDVCIINPQRREIIKVNGHNTSAVISKAIEAKDW